MIDNREPPTLEALARSRFGDLTAAESLVTRSAVEGKIAECSPNPQDPKAPENDPAHADSWGEQRKVRAGLIRWLCVDTEASARVDPRGIWIHAAQFVDELDLSFASVRFPLRFFNCRFSAEINLAEANLRAFYLSGSRTRAIAAAGVRVDGDVLLGDEFYAEGEVRLIGADIRGDLLCGSGRFKNLGQYALNADRVKVAGSVFLRNGFGAEGEVRLLGADIGSNLECDRGTFKNPGKFVLNADSAKIRGSVFLRNGFGAEGAVLLLGADIGGTLECDSGSFKNPGQGALFADRVKVAGSVFLRNGFNAEGEVRLLGADIGSDLEGGNGTFKNPGKVALNADGAKVRGSVHLRSAFSAEGEVLLLGANIGGTLDCDSGSFRNPGKVALNADRVKVAGSVFLRNGFGAEGEVRLLGADIGGTLECDNGRFESLGRYALNADRVKVAGSVFLRNGFGAEGEVRLLGADIGSNLECDRGTFKNPGKFVLNADSAKIRGSVFLRNGFGAEGAVLLLGADIGGTLECDSGSFKNPGQGALIADRVKVAGSVFLRNGFNAEGEVRLPGADIGSNLEVTRADLTGTSLVAFGANAKGAFVFREAAKTTEAQAARSKIDLRGASVGTLTDDLESWPDSGNLFLNGFVYNRIADAPTDARGRLNWLRRSQGLGRYRPQPYQQLARVLREQGHEAEALMILVGMQDDRRKYASLPWHGWLWAWVLKITIGYGYRPLFALGWIMFFVALGFIIFGLGYRGGLLAPTDKDAYSRFVETGRASVGYEPFCAAVYSINTFVPLIDLDQKERWMPNPVRSKLAEHPSSHPLARVLCDAAIVDVLPRQMTPSASFLRIYRWGHILLGWFFTTMFVAGITGLVRR